MLTGGITRHRRNRRTLAYIIIDLDSTDIEYMAIAEVQNPAITDVNSISEPSLGNECCICLDSDGDIRKFSCGHYMHEDCSLKWFEQSNTCPTCRIEFVP